MRAKDIMNRSSPLRPGPRPSVHACGTTAPPKPGGVSTRPERGRRRCSHRPAARHRPLARRRRRGYTNAPRRTSPPPRRSHGRTQRRSHVAPRANSRVWSTTSSSGSAATSRRSRPARARPPGPRHDRGLGRRKRTGHRDGTPADGYHRGPWNAVMGALPRRSRLSAARRVRHRARPWHRGPGRGHRRPPACTTGRRRPCRRRGCVPGPRDRDPGDPQVPACHRRPVDSAARGRPPDARRAAGRGRTDRGGAAAMGHPPRRIGGCSVTVRIPVAAARALRAGGHDAGCVVSGPGWVPGSMWA